MKTNCGERVGDDIQVAASTDMLTLSCGRIKKLDLEATATHILEECRMVLPGIQALFGFQLVAVFNQRFETVPFSNQLVHLLATASVVLSAGLVMSPAAFHRIAEPDQVSQRFVRISSLLLLISMALLATGISLDIYVVSSLIFANPGIAFSCACSLFVTLVTLWFLIPAMARKRNRRRSAQNDRPHLERPYSIP
jgi:hypothetical protein